MIAPRKGARVVELRIEDIEELSEAREAFEMVFFYRSVKNIPRQKFKQIREKLINSIKEFDASDDDPERMQRKISEYLEFDFTFHRSLVEAAGNRMWLKYYDGILGRAKLFSHLTVKKNPKLFDEVANDHLAIVNAILAEDFSEAKWLLRHSKLLEKYRSTRLPGTTIQQYGRLIGERYPTSKLASLRAITRGYPLLAGHQDRSSAIRYSISQLIRRPFSRQSYRLVSAAIS